MYLGFYGLAKEPFHITPDPGFLFLSPSHKEAFGALMYGVEQRKGFVALTGEVGTGKTTILRTYLKNTEKSAIRPIYIFDPDLTFEDLLNLILKELGNEPKQKLSVPAMLERLNWALIHEYKQGRNVTLFVDEAQNMPVETLEKLRMLSNLETTEDKLIQIVLVGQPELDDKLSAYSMRQLNQRIAVRARVKPLTDRESEEYIQHRLSLAGCNRSEVFSRSAMKLIIQRAQGNPRILNIVCDNALANGYGHQAETIEPKIVKEVLKEMKPSRRPVPRWAWRGAMAAAALAVVIAGGYLLTMSVASWRAEPDATANIAHASTPSPEPSPSAAEPKSSPAVPGSSDPVKIALAKMKQVTGVSAGSGKIGESAAPMPKENPPAAEVAAEANTQSALPTPEETVAAQAGEPSLQAIPQPVEIAAPSGMKHETIPEPPKAGEAKTPSIPETAKMAVEAVEPPKPPVEAAKAAEPPKPSVEAPVEAAKAVEPPKPPVEAPVTVAKVVEPPKPAVEPPKPPVEAPVEVAKVVEPPKPAAAPPEVVTEPPKPPAETPKGAVEPPRVLAKVEAIPDTTVDSQKVVTEATKALIEPPKMAVEPVPVSITKESPKPVSDGVVAPANAENTRRVVVKGDSLSKLVAQVYGRSSDALIQEVQRLNPQISDPNKIVEGDTLVFPIKADLPMNVEGAGMPAPESSNPVSDRSNP